MLRNALEFGAVNAVDKIVGETFPSKLAVGDTLQIGILPQLHDLSYAVIFHLPQLPSVSLTRCDLFTQGDESGWP